MGQIRLITADSQSPLSRYVELLSVAVRRFPIFVDRDLEAIRILRADPALPDVLVRSDRWYWHRRIANNKGKIPKASRVWTRRDEQFVQVEFGPLPVDIGPFKPLVGTGRRTDRLATRLSRVHDDLFPLVLDEARQDGTMAVLGTKLEAAKTAFDEVRGLSREIADCNANREELKPKIHAINELIVEFFPYMKSPRFKGQLELAQREIANRTSVETEAPLRFAIAVVMGVENAIGMLFALRNNRTGEFLACAANVLECELYARVNPWEIEEVWKTWPTSEELITFGRYHFTANSALRLAHAFVQGQVADLHYARLKAFPNQSIEPIERGKLDPWREAFQEEMAVRRPEFVEWPDWSLRQERDRFLARIRSEMLKWKAANSAQSSGAKSKEDESAERQSLGRGLWNCISACHSVGSDPYKLVALLKDRGECGYSEVGDTLCMNEKSNSVRNNRFHAVVRRVNLSAKRNGANCHVVRDPSNKNRVVVRVGYRKSVKKRKR